MSALGAGSMATCSVAKPPSAMAWRMMRVLLPLPTSTIRRGARMRSVA